MAKISAKIEERRQRLHTKAYFFLSVLLLVTMGIYTYFQFNEYRLLADGVDKGQELESSLRAEVVEVMEEYESNRELFDRFQKTIEENLKNVFPDEDNYTDLTRQLDTFEESLASGRSPFEVSNINYQAVIERENYFILPFRMNIRSSSENFTRFLHMMENSGAIDGDVRLMSVSSIRLSFQGSPVADPTEIINFTVQVNAYFQK